MKKSFTLFAAIAFLVVSCTSNPSGKNNASQASLEVVDVDSVLASPQKFIEKTVSIKGLVVHTCRHSGKKMFLAGTDKNKFVKVIAGPGISRFDQSLEGETVVATGKLGIIDETEEKHASEREGKGVMKAAETSSQDTAKAGCVTETKIKKYQLVCNRFTTVEQQ